MSRFVTLSQFKEIMFLHVIVEHNIGAFENHWYVELDEAFNFHLCLHRYNVEEGSPIVISIVSSIDVINKNILRSKIK